MIIAFIPARAGSKRVPGKNIIPFCGHSLIAYAIQSAKDSGIFDDIYVSSDSEEYLAEAVEHGAKTILRPDYKAKDNSCDHEWIAHAVAELELKDKTIYAILRPTNPFRTGETIKAAWEKYLEGDCRSLKSIQPVTEHPGKMWEIINGTGISCAETGYAQNLPTQNLHKTYIQNGCIYINKVPANVWGNEITPFITPGYEGFDINTPEDWVLAEELVKRGMAKTPEIKR